MESLWILVKVHPNAKKDVLVRHGLTRFEAWVRAKPIAGEANMALETLLASALSIPRSRLRLVKGASSRNKVFRLL
jgi:uncharacterized protein YggU (UPF0235/DUF167 family)